MAQSLTESLVLSFLGCAAAWRSRSGAERRSRRASFPMSRRSASSTDWRTLVVEIAAAVMAGVLAGLAPVVFAQHEELARTLKAGVREGTFVRSRLRTGLLVAQGALSVVLLVGAGLFVKVSGTSGNAPRLRRVGRPAGELGRRGVQSPTARRRLSRTPDASRGRAPRSRTCACDQQRRDWRARSTQNLSVRGIDSVAELGRFDSQTATPDYFATMRTRILRGRGIHAWTDTPHAAA